MDPNSIDTSGVNDWSYDPSQATSGDASSNDPNSPVQDGSGPDQAALGQAIVDQASGNYQAQLGQQIVDQAAGDYQAKLGQSIVDQASGDYQTQLGKQIVADTQAQNANTPGTIFNQFTGALGNLFRAAQVGSDAASKFTGVNVVPQTVTRPQQILTPSVRGGSTQPRSWLSLFPSLTSGKTGTTASAGPVSLGDQLGAGLGNGATILAYAVGAVIIGWGIKQFAHK